MELRILHLADVHLGASFPWLGDRGGAQRRRLRETFGQVLRKAASDGAHLVLIAGDLFASPRPSQDLTEFVISHLTRLAQSGVETVIAAGEADACDPDGIYAGGAFQGTSGVTVLPAAPRAVEFPHLGLAVIGRSVGRAQNRGDPVGNLPPGTQPRTVGLLHVHPSRAGGGEAVVRSAGSRFTYFALGGSHRTLDVSTDGVVAWYPGSLELVVQEEHEGAALWVEVGAGGVKVTTVPVGRRRFKRIVLEPAMHATQEALATEIEGHADGNLALEVRLAGRAHPAQHIDTQDLEQTLGSRFFALRVVDEAMVDLSLLEAPQIPEINVVGKFSTLMRQQLDQARSEAEGQRVSAAFRLGLWLLRGQGR